MTPLTPLETKLVRLPGHVADRILKWSYAPPGMDGAIRVLTDEPLDCTGCGESHHLFVNRAGATLCWMCDAAAQTGRPV
jgi:hypothetical protein